MTSRFIRPLSAVALSAGLILVGAGCAAPSKTTISTSASPTPASPTAQAPSTFPAGKPTPAPTQPQPRMPNAPETSTLTITVTGAESIKGTFPAHCGFADPLKMGGVIFQSEFKGWSLTSTNETSRQAGVQTVSALLSSPQNHVYHQDVTSSDYSVMYGTDMKNADIKGTFVALNKPTNLKVKVDATFLCN